MAWFDFLRSRKKPYCHGSEIAIPLPQSNIWNLVTVDWLSPSELAGAGRSEKQVAASFTCVAPDHSAFLKVQLRRHPRKRNDIMQEAALLASLAEKGCATAPALLGAGMLDRDTLLAGLPPELRPDQPSSLDPTLPYLVEEYLPNEGTPQLADVLLAMLEQKALGIYHGDVKPDNIRFDAGQGLCRLVDYDQAMPLPEPVLSMNTPDFLHWCDGQERQRYPGQTTWLRHFPSSVRRQLADCLAGGSLNLAKTSICRRQATTNSKSGVYHSLQTPLVSVAGSRTLEGRQQILDAMSFTPGERVLDIGCNLGILSHYLHDRGCKVTAGDMDTAVVTLGGIVARILGRHITFRALDLDATETLPEMDTICLFSVIHHTRNMEENGKKIARACKRIILECRLVEKGKKPVVEGGTTVWKDTSKFDFANETELENYLPSLFPGFTNVTKQGHVDKGRMIYELARPE
ncbi:methyltransferase domain-containing protein [Nitratidesulfovibrio liaohensis]|uniref:Methyltransferase domain-containing protein n=1 Tax=Nitratidesulfovibrio liaohensis TaxID=2604158 RepID=A0ABY9R3E8_9BACT|nr:methyltransferase domain-containing protein [Nitratidesulfovibrio liaohensis]WMW66280.1 methyltransferase domain-containing protein [Nitratidesulfovibrio liaohensis]